MSKPASVLKSIAWAFALGLGIGVGFSSPAILRAYQEPKTPATLKANMMSCDTLRCERVVIEDRDGKPRAFLGIGYGKDDKDPSLFLMYKDRSPAAHILMTEQGPRFLLLDSEGDTIAQLPADAK